MLGLGWTEMLLIAALALIVVGPRDLPIMLRQLGRAFGIMRRMGNEFKSEFNKMAALDEVKDIRKSITDPLRNAQAEIQREFNKTTATGVQPSGALKPDAGEGESVVNAIKTQAGMNASPVDEAMKSALAQSRQKVPDDVPVELAGDTTKTGVEKAAATKAKSAKSTPAKSAGAKAKPAAKSASKSASAKPATAKAETARSAAAAKPKPATKSAGKASAKSAPTAKKAPAAKPAPSAEAAPAATTESKPAPKPRVARKPAAKPAVAKTATDKSAEAKTAADKPAAAKPARKRTASKTEKA